MTYDKFKIEKCLNHRVSDPIRELNKRQSKFDFI